MQKLDYIMSDYFPGKLKLCIPCLMLKKFTSSLRTKMQNSVRDKIHAKKDLDIFSSDKLQASTVYTLQ